MRIMVLGGAGFIGRHIMAELLSAGHEVVAVVRGIGNLQEAFPRAMFLSLDLAREVHSCGWRTHLTGIEAIVNAAGTLARSRHARGPRRDAGGLAFGRA